MTIHILCLGGARTGLASRLVRGLPAQLGPGHDIRIREVGQDGTIQELFAQGFAQAQGIVAIMALGIVTRMLAPLVQSKLTDPAVVALDDQGRWAISSLSGHEGGANALAYAVAAVCGAEPVITTGTETKRFVTLGVGCRRGSSASTIVEAVQLALGEAGVALPELRCAASVALKRDEPGLVEAMRQLELPIVFYEERRIKEFAGDYQSCPAAERQLGLPAVAEPCALLAARDGDIILPRRVYQGVTIALAREVPRWQAE